MSDLLSERELRELVTLLRNLFLHVESVRNSHPLGGHIKRLQVPSILSESLAAYLLNSGRLGVRLPVTASSSRGDLEGATPSGSPPRVEVKATTKTGWCQFGSNDLKADLLVWIDFGEYFWNTSESHIDVYFLPSPGDVFKTTRKVTLKKFLLDAGDKVYHNRVDLNEVLASPVSA